MTAAAKQLMAPARRQFLMLGASLAMATAYSVLSGCDRRAPLSIAGHSFPGYEFIFLARDETWLDTQWVRLHETNSASESLAALANDNVDGALLTLDETLLARNQGIPLTIILILDRSVGADALLAAPGIEKLDRLKGKRVGVENSAVGRLVLDFALQRSGLTQADIKPFNLPVNQHIEACTVGAVDAIVTYEPSLRAIANQGWHNLLDSREMDLIFDVIAVKTDKLSTNARRIVHLIDAHLKGAQGWRNRSIDTMYRLSRRLQVPPDEIWSLYRGLDLPDLNYNRHMLSPENPYLLNVAGKVANALGYSNALIGAENNLFTAGFLPNSAP